MKYGITLVELIIVVACLGALIAIALPAVNSSRTAARGMECQSRMRQVCLGAIHHESAQGFFPSGGWGTAWIGLKDRGFGRNQPGSWLFSLLDFTEYQNLRQLSPSSTSPLTQEETNSYLTSPVPLFSCPDRSLPEINRANNRLVYRYATSVLSTARSDFCVNSGPETLENGPGPIDLDVSSYRWLPTRSAYGLAHLRSQVRASEVSDGLSNVFYCGEKWAPLVISGDELGYDQTWAAADCQDVRRSTEEPPRRDGSPDGTFLIFGSSHPSGCNFSFADGATRVISLSVHPDVFRALGDRRDGKSLNLD
jgi:prepilin-type processing-associated H-X9-DG protein